MRRLFGRLTSSSRLGIFQFSMIRYMLHFLGQEFVLSCRYIIWRDSRRKQLKCPPQVAVNDTNKLASVVEGLAQTAELISRYAVTEALYLQNKSEATKELERALVKLYADILSYLFKAKQYVEQGTAS